MNIVVLAGGLSTERDVSFSTGTMVSQALRKKGHNVILLDVFMGYKDEECDVKGIFERVDEVNAFTAQFADHSRAAAGADGTIPDTAPDLAAVRAMRRDQSASFFGPNVIAICRAADFVFLALHGENGENGKVQAAFDLFGIRYTGTGYLSSALAMDKGLTKKLFEAGGIPTPHGISLKVTERELPFEETGLTLPCVVKPCCGGSSIGVSIVRTAEEYKEALDAAFRFENEVVIEDYIQGREFSVGVMQHQALPVIEIAPVEGFYNYKNKYKAGSTVETCPALLTEETAARMQEIAVQVCDVLGLTAYSRMDFLLKENGDMYCLEANTLPGMTPTSLLPQEAAAIGIAYEDLCEKMIEISMAGDEAK